MDQKEGLDFFTSPPTASGRQIGGDHYLRLKIGPAEFCHRNGFGYLVSNIIKRACSYAMVIDPEELDKLIHEAELLKELDKPQD